MPVLPVSGADAVERAFIAVESNGDPCAHRPNSQFWGMYQMGKAAAADVGLNDPSVLHCNPGLARWAWKRYLTRYAKYHEWDPAMQAVTWKGGPGTAKYVQGEVWRGVPLALALAEAEKPGVVTPGGVPNLVEYVDRFTHHLVRFG